MSMLPARLWAAVAPRHGYQRALYRSGALLVIGGLLHLGMLAADGFTWGGAVSWRKPIVFGLSLGMAAWSVGWVLGHLPPRRLLGWGVAIGVGGFSLIEWALITVQRWRGVPSHFNFTTALDGAIFSAMGIAVSVVALAFLVTLGWAWRELHEPPEIRWAALVGLGLLLVASGLGGDLIARGTAEMVATGTVPGGVRIGAAGSGKLAHGIGLHGIQVLGVIAVLLGLGDLDQETRARLLRAASVAYTIGFATVVGQVYAGRALVDLVPLAAIALLGSLVVLAWIGWLALRSAVAASRRPAVRVA